MSIKLHHALHLVVYLKDRPADPKARKVTKKFGPYMIFQDHCHITLSTDAGLAVHTDSGLADNKYCFNVVLLWILNFLYCTDRSDRHATGRLSCLQ